MVDRGWCEQERDMRRYENEHENGESQVAHEHD